MRKLLRRFELRAALLAAVALLIAQMGAMSHAYSHDAAVSPSSHQTGAGSHNPCDDCLAYAPLLATAGTAGAMPFIAAEGHGSAIRTATASRVDLSLILAFRSRAPPAKP